MTFVSSPNFCLSKSTPQLEVKVLSRQTLEASGVVWMFCAVTNADTITRDRDTEVADDTDDQI